MSQQTVAFRYAKSLLDLAKERKVEDKVYEDMKFFGQVCDDNHDFYLLLKSPIVSHFDKLTILQKIFTGKVDTSSMSIFEIITKKNREEMLPHIAEDYLRQYELLKGIQKAYVTTATPLTATQKIEFQKIVADATGKTVEVVEKIDESLIGGYVLTVNDRQIDTSVKTKLNELKIKFLN
ncbi:ATP synthase F1 subunit delta [Arcicella sp. LKC2W]|uniref:ATP synthase F1 subunit delta n=1 Tax=Arcicella sp. LKC2W TaxID=2984198 RepID=UPI002B2093EE|nr:ATP synthase F1 subunit delta [Arcicella sp. LKC2W]MEA5459052.1 ATP synthase F1 subunit delta [Arcicella sp. LKC2W]